MTPDVLKHFVLDTHWPQMQDYIESFFEYATDVEQIDTSLPSEVVHAHVKASQEIKKALALMKSDFDAARNEAVQKKTSFR